MRILLDAYWWLSGPPSGRNVIRSLVSTWSQSHPSDSLTLLVRHAEARAVQADLDRLGLGHIKLRCTRLRPHAIAAVLAPKRNYDAVLTQNFAAVRPGRARGGVFVHDLIFRDHPEWFSARERVYLSPIVRLARFSDQVFTSSASEADRIKRYLPAGAIAVGLALPLDYDRSGSKKPALPLREHRYILAVGRLNARKNLSRLIATLVEGRLVDSSAPLVVVGKADGRQDTDCDVPTASVVWTGHVENAELKWLYENCSVFVFPSLDEGFGLPVLEAADAGAPIAMSAIPSFMEFDVRAELFDPTSQADIKNAIKRAIDAQHRTERLHAEWDDVVNRVRSGLGVELCGVEPS